jgi:hypothetical protein
MHSVGYCSAYRLLLQLRVVTCWSCYFILTVQEERKYPPGTAQRRLLQCIQTASFTGGNLVQPQINGCTYFSAACMTRPRVHCWDYSIPQCNKELLHSIQQARDFIQAPNVGTCFSSCMTLTREEDEALHNGGCCSVTIMNCLIWYCGSEPCLVLPGQKWLRLFQHCMHVRVHEALHIGGYSTLQYNNGLLHLS